MLKLLRVEPHSRKVRRHLDNGIEIGNISKVDQFLYLDWAGLGDHELLPVTSDRNLEQDNMRYVSRASYILQHSAIEPLFYEAHKFVCANRRLSFSMRLLLVASSQNMSI
jgi:hypothetical protein